jgi:uncharacterized repeat protein (TIGR01451 family)
MTNEPLSHAPKVLQAASFRVLFATWSLVVLFSAGIAGALPAQTPRVWYVSTAGSDSSAGTRFAAFKTIQHGIDVAVAGDTVIVLEGRYAGPGNVDLDFEGKAITVQSRNPADPACVRATVLDAAGNGAIAHFNHDEGRNTVMDGFSIVLGDTTRVAIGMPGYIERSLGARPTTRHFRLESASQATGIDSIAHAGTKGPRPMDQSGIGMAAGTPVGGREWSGANPFVQPAPTTNYWGSGDVDGDGLVTSNDAVLAENMASDPLSAQMTADVNGDGVVDATDVAMINAAAAGGSLPAWWNKLTTQADRVAWMDKVRALEPTKNYTEDVGWWQCEQYATQTMFHGSFYRNDLFGTFYGGGQTWFNVPMYFAVLSFGHAINGVLVGDNPLVLNDWLLFDPQGDFGVNPVDNSAYFASGTAITLHVPDHVTSGGAVYLNGQAAVTFLMGDNGTYTVDEQDPNLVLTRPAQPPTVVVDNRPDLWNPRILAVGSGMLLFGRERADMTRGEDIHLTTLPLVDPPTATPLVLDTQFARLLDVAYAPDQTIHLLWNGGSEYVPGVFSGVLNVNTKTLSAVNRITPFTAPTYNDEREVHGGRLIYTQSGDLYAFWTVRASRASASYEPDLYQTGVYWSKWNGSSWSPEQLAAPSNYFEGPNGSWHDNDPSRYFFDVVPDTTGGIVLVWANVTDGNTQEITIQSEHFDGSTWSAPVTIEATGTEAGVSLARDAGGLIHLVYWNTGSGLDVAGAGNLLHRTFDGTSWSAPDTVDDGGYASTPHMVATPSYLYLVWQRDTTTQKVPVWRTWANSAWSTDHVVPVRSGADAFYPTADALPDGRIAMTWSSRSADRASLETAYMQGLNLNVSLSHTGNFTQHDIGDAYQIAVQNAGGSATAGTVTVTDTLPAGLIATSISGTGWSCGLSPLSCTRTDSLAASSSFPAITVLVNVTADAAASVTNSVTLSSADEMLIGTNVATDPTTINATYTAPQLSIASTHASDFYQGETGATYTVLVSNGVLAGDTSGAVTVTEALPTGLTLVSITGTGWTCAGASCSRSDSLVGGSNYPALIVTVSVSANAPSPLVNAVSVSGGGSSTATATDSTVVETPTGTPVFSVAAGSYSSAQTVSISDTTAGATIYYRLTNSGPTPYSAYSMPITVSQSETIQAYATANGHSTSPAVSATYLINGQVATPVLGLPSGTYSGLQNVSITDSTQGATIYYTTDGSAPSNASNQYFGPISVVSSETLQAIAVKDGYTNSAIATASYTIQAPAAATPLFSVAPGSYASAQTVSISDSTPGASIYYTTNGSTPTGSSTLYTGPIAISASATLQAIAIATNYSNSAVASASYTINGQALSPVFSVPAGSYASTQTVSITDATSGASLYYTTNGATPTSGSTLYTGPITVSLNETLEAIAVATNYSNSAVATATYTINGSTAAPVFSIPSGSYANSQTVSITDATQGALIYYTTDGTLPGSFSTVYSGPIVVSTSETLNAVALATNYNPSAITSAHYTINGPAATPVFSVPAGSYASTQSVTITDGTQGAAIYYTTNGSTPSNSSILYTGPITVSNSETLEAIAIAANYNNSAVASATYTINGQAATPVFSVGSGSYATAQTVTITDATQGATIYYTTNGTIPTNASTPYSGAITVSSNETLEAIAIAANYSSSAVASATFTINGPAATPVFSVAAGSYATAQTVAITDATSGASIYYTTNGNTPTTASALYSAPITVSTSETLAAIAVAANYGNSAVASASYTIGAPQYPAPAIVSISPPFTTAGGPTFQITVLGTGFLASSTVYWGSSALSTQYGSATQLTAQVPASDIALAGITQLTVQNAAPGSGTSNPMAFEVDTASSTTTPPAFATTTAMVSAGAPANYPVTLPSSVLSATVSCLNLPPGTTCSYSAQTNSVIISTSSATPNGSYQITVIFTETLPGAAAGFLLLPLSLLPLAGKRSVRSKRVGAAMAATILLVATAFAIGCAGAGAGTRTTTSQTHQVTSSGTVMLTIQ